MQRIMTSSSSNNEAGMGPAGIYSSWRLHSSSSSSIHPHHPNRHANMGLLFSPESSFSMAKTQITAGPALLPGNFAIRIAAAERRNSTAERQRAPAPATTLERESRR